MTLACGVGERAHLPARGDGGAGGAAALCAPRTCVLRRTHCVVRTGRRWQTCATPRTHTLYRIVGTRTVLPPHVWLHHSAHFRFTLVRGCRLAGTVQRHFGSFNHRIAVCAARRSTQPTHLLPVCCARAAKTARFCAAFSLYALYHHRATVALVLFTAPGALADGSSKLLNAAASAVHNIINCAHTL